MEGVLTVSNDQTSNILPKDEESSGDHKKRVASDSSDKENVANDDQVKFNRLVTKAKQLAAEGQVQMALELNKRALKICYHEKLAKRIAKMEAYLKECEQEEEESDEDNGMVHVGKGFYLFKDLQTKLYSHQQEGILWMWGLHIKKKGGILGDDMGLGKTIQVIAFLSGLFDMDKVHAVIIVMPVSVIVNWENEFKKWAPGIRVTCFHGSSKREKERALGKVQRRGGVCLTSYGMVVTSWEQLSQQNGREFVWDYMILDEGHKIKNPTKTTKAVHAIGANNRLILTGTPIQNNLRELWSLFDFVHKGSLLGTARTFKMEFENPITRARERDATIGERKLGQEMAESLKKIIAPYFLRRTKAEVTTNEEKENTCPEGGEDNETDGKMPSFTRKNDFIIWLFLTQTQQKIYHDFISLDSVKELLMTKKSPLVALTVLKKISDHPRLLSKRACAQLGLDGQDRMDDSDLMESEDGLTCAANQIQHIDDNVLINESGKLIFIAQLLDQLKMEGHRTLLFSQSRKMLDIIEKVITNRGHKVKRLDGTVTHMCDRDKIIRQFQTDNSYSVFLLTTQVGGVGLTLTAADRVVIYDPSWNPATDAQAVDRVFRIGQNKNVVIYRLITCGTVEEKIYRRQIFKDSITRQTTGNAKNPYRYFTKQELRELFSLDDPRFSKTQQQLEDMHSGSRISDPSLDAHIAFLYSLDMFGLTDHDLMFNHETGKMNDHCEDAEEPAVESNHLSGNDYIQHRVQKAQELIRMESELGGTFQERISKYPRNIDARDNIPQPKREPRNFTFGPSQAYIPQEDSRLPNQEKHNTSVDCIDLTCVEEASNASSPGNHGDAIDLTEDEEIADVEHKMENMSFKETPIKPQIVDLASEDEQEQQMDHTDKKIKTEDISIKQEPQGHASPHLIHELNENKSQGHFLPVKQEPHSPLSEDSVTPDLRVKQEPETDQQEVISADELPKSDSDNSSPDPKEIVSLLETPEKMEPYTPKGSSTKNRRKSVSQSPWLARTPKSGRKSSVVEEGIFISPDASRPVVKTEPKMSSLIESLPSARLNSTIFSAFSDSPDVNDNCRDSLNSESDMSDSPRSSPDQQGDDHRNNLYTTFVGDSPELGKYKSNLYKTFVGDSPNGVDVSGKQTPSITELSDEEMCVLDSVQNTPAVNLPRDEVEDSYNNTDEAVQDTDDDSTPVKRPMLGAQDVSMGTPLNMSMDSPLATSRGRRQNKRAVIQSTDEEDSGTEEQSSENNSSYKETKDKSVASMSGDDDRSDNDNYMDCSSSEKMPSSGNSMSSSKHYDEKDSKRKKSLPSKSDYISKEVDDDGDGDGDDDEDEDEDDGSDEEEEECEESDLSGFIVDDDEMEEDESSTDESDEADESVDNDEQDFGRLTEAQKSLYTDLVRSSRSQLKSGSYEEALANVLQALEIFPEPSTQALALTIHKKMEP